MLEFQELDRSVKTASIWQVRQPVYQTSKARWKSYSKYLEPLEKAMQIVPPMPDPLPLPTVPPGSFILGIESLRQGRLDEAEANFKAIITSNPTHAAAYHFLGGTLLRKGQFQQAIQAMRKSVKLLPIHATWFENLALAEECGGNMDEAKQALNHAERLRNKELP